MENLSVVIITKNELENIKICLKKILDFAKEIIILDSGSIDGTIDYINNLNNKKIIFKKVLWLGFGPTKNIGIKMAKFDWILSLDSDEFLTDELKKEIKFVINKNDKNINGYFIPRNLFFCEKKVKFGGVYPDYQLRLFRKGKGLFNDLDVHESLIISGKKLFLKSPLDHYSYKTMFLYWERFNKYTNLDAIKKFKQGKKFYFLKIFILFFELFKRLILKCGIFDGFPGIFYHVFSSMSSFVKYAKLWELEKINKDKRDKL